MVFRLRFEWQPQTERRSNQSILKEINPECSLEALMLKLKLQCPGSLIRRADSLEKTLMLGKIEGKRRRGRQRTRWLDGITDSMDMNLRKFWEIVKDRGAWHAFVHGVSRSPTWPSNCTTTQQQQGFSHGKIQRDGITCGGSTWNKGTSVRDTALVHTQTWTYSSDIDRHQTNK